MVFKAAEWTRQAARDVPDSKLAGDFVLEGNGIQSGDRPVMVGAETGKPCTIADVELRVDLLTRSLQRLLGWSPNEGAPEDKVVGICSFNTTDFLPLSWAIHRVGGTCLLLHPSSSAVELEKLTHQAKCIALFACKELLPTCQQLVDPSRLFLLDMPGDDQTAVEMQTVSQLIADGESLPSPQGVVLQAGESKSRVAYLCPTSGTSGYQKLAQITHFNVMANILQFAAVDGYARKCPYETALGVLPLSHAYGLITCHVMLWRRDTTILHSKFDMPAALRSIQQHRIQRLNLVPAIVVALVNNPFLFKMADLSSVQTVLCGSATLSADMVAVLKGLRPEWVLLGGYGLTEAAVVVSVTSRHSIFLGSVGSLLTNVEARLVAEDGTEIQEYDVPGELFLRSPSVMKGYLVEKAEDAVVFTEDGWLITGDVACFRKGEDEEEHLFIMDRKKSIMKVKGIQVAPAEIESQLLNHAAVDEAAVFGIQDSKAGERPFAFVVRSKVANVDLDENALGEALHAHIQQRLSEPFWLRENVKFVDSIPKSSSGKPLKFKLKELI